MIPVTPTHPDRFVFPSIRPALVAMAVGLAGCGPAADAPGAGGESRAASSALASRTLEAPPDLQVGEWWTLEVDPTLVGATYPTTLVVTGRTGDQATIGIPPAEFAHDFLVLHVPPLGDLDLNTFAWRVMWDDFEALRFPLELGRTWTADFHGRDVEAEVTAVEGHRAHVTMIGDGERIEFTYDAEIGMITDFREEALGLAFRVTDHGFDYAGEVMTPSGIQLALMESPAGAPTHHEGDARGVSTSVEVDTGGSHGSLSLVLWNVGYENRDGTYRITVTAPDGTTFEERFEGPERGEAVAVQSFGHDAVTGTWQVEFERDGPAGLLVELFTYDLTEGRVGGADGS
jgi:hypothetical protein